MADVITTRHAPGSKRSPDCSTYSIRRVTIDIESVPGAAVGDTPCRIGPMAMMRVPPTRLEQGQGRDRDDRLLGISTEAAGAIELVG